MDISFFGTDKKIKIFNKNDIKHFGLRITTIKNKHSTQLLKKIGYILEGNLKDLSV